MRGYFGVGAEGISKAMNVGSLLRSAHAFGASFMFTAAAIYSRSEGGKADTSDSEGHVPFFAFPDVASIVLPRGCTLVGVELVDEAIDLPTFRHPRRAAYVFGPERGSLSPEMVEKCEFLIRIPTRFSVNVGIAGAIVMYDRILNLGHYPKRPMRPGGPIDPLPEHVFGGPVIRQKMEGFRESPPVPNQDGNID